MKRRSERLIRTGLPFLLVALVCVTALGVFGGLLRAADGAETPAPASDGTGETVYLDLAAGDVTIGASTYSGKVYVGGEPKDITGKHEANNRYYIYQSTAANKAETGYVDNEAYNSNDCTVPEYKRVEVGTKLWTDYITNNTEVKEVSEAWDNAAGASQRTPTKNHITFDSASDYTANVIIDNIWTTYFDTTSTESRKRGGIGVHLKDTGVEHQNTHIYLSLKGDNRVGCVHYSAGEKQGNTIEFSAFDPADHTSGSITVADFKENFRANHWCSAIGGADNPAGRADQSDGIVIHSGVIYAGTTPEDNCTAIGGGGNDYGGVTINGGIVTAVTAGTGTAIGGGIGYSDPGGDTDVTINGGEIYAYNFGIEKGVGDPFYTNVTQNFIPSAAIGGGGSGRSEGNLNANLTITGGKIYAQSMGGPAIGGGGSANLAGGPANITITGGTIIAKSVSGTYAGKPVSAGAAIGGGTGKTQGGTVTLNISGKETIIRAGSIGGGSATEKDANGKKKIGSANVTIEDGDIIGQVVMAGGANTKCTFDMSGGRIHDTDVINGIFLDEAIDPQVDVLVEYIEHDGGAVWMEDEAGVTNITGGTIEGCTAKLGGAVYMQGGTFTMSGGTIRDNTATTDVTTEDPKAKKGLGGAVYVQGGTANIEGGFIGEENAANTAVDGAGVYVTGGSVNVTENASISYNHAANKGGGVYLDKDTGSSDWNFTLDGENASISHNQAQSGAGAYLYKNPILKRGKIEQNTASGNGGGLYINDCVVTLDAEAPVAINGNKAMNGAGICINRSPAAITTGLVMKSKTVAITGNIAENNGGGVYVNGNFDMLYGTIGSKNTPEDGNSAANGGGIYVNEGNATIVNGDISYNKATGSGGGVCMFAKDAGDVKVIMLSGCLSHNTAKVDGGGMAVEGEGNQKITAEIGCRLNHNLKVDGKPTYSIQYTGDHYADYANYHGVSNEHASCPKVEYNSAGKAGGAIHMKSNSSELSFFCVEESENTTGDPEAADVEVEGGSVNIGDSVYHNERFNESKNGENLPAPGGYISITSSIMVTGGLVNIYGDMDNPTFKEDDVVVRITDWEQNYFMDHRYFTDEDTYVVRYFENFTDGTGGRYFYDSYDPTPEKPDDPDSKPLFVKAVKSSRPGYIFRGWCKNRDSHAGETDCPHFTVGKPISTETDFRGQTHEEVDERCTFCEFYTTDRVLDLYGVWEKSEGKYKLTKDETVPVEAWTITYGEGESTQTLTYETAELEVGTKVTFTPGESTLPLTLTFEDRVTHEKVVESLERLVENKYAPIGSDPKFNVLVSKNEENGVYVLHMPDKDVTVSSVWGLYLDHGTIELFKDGFMQQKYWYGEGKKIAWSGDYRIWQCEDNKEGATCIHHHGGSDGHASHTTPNVLQLNEDLSGRNIFLGNLNISSKNSIELKPGAAATLTQEGTLGAKNILVPTGASLTLKQGGTACDAAKAVTLKPDPEDAAIGGIQADDDSKKGNGDITLNRVALAMHLEGDGTGIGPAGRRAAAADGDITVTGSMITVTGSMITASGGEDTGYILDGDLVTLEDSSIGTTSVPAIERIHAASKLKITESRIY